MSTNEPEIKRAERPPPKTYGEILRRAREESGKTMGELARFLGRSTYEVSDVERGVRSPFPAEETDRIAAFIGASGLRVRVDLLLAAVEWPPRKSEPPAPTPDRAPGDDPYCCDGSGVTDVCHCGSDVNTPAAHDHEIRAMECPARTHRAPGEGERLTDAEIAELERICASLVAGSEDSKGVCDACGDAYSVRPDCEDTGVCDLCAQRVATLAPRLLADLRATRRERDAYRDLTRAGKEIVANLRESGSAMQQKARADAAEHAESQEKVGNLVVELETARSEASHFEQAAEDARHERDSAQHALEKERAEHAKTRAEGERVRAALNDREQIGQMYHAAWCAERRAKGEHGPDESCTAPKFLFWECGSMARYEERRDGACALFNERLRDWPSLPEPRREAYRAALDVFRAALAPAQSTEDPK